MRRFRTTLLVATLLVPLVGCSATSGHRSLTDDEGSLETLYPRIRQDALKLFLGLTIRNPHDEEIEGVRVVYQVMTSGAPDAMEITRVQQEFPVIIPAGDVAVIEIALPAEARSRSAGAIIKAFAAKRGGRTVPLPHLWHTKAPPRAANP